MKCAFCGREFDESGCQTGCKVCALVTGCKKIKCPHCGYESPADTRLVKWLRKKLGKQHDQSTG